MLLYSETETWYILESVFLQNSSKVLKFKVAIVLNMCTVYKDYIKKYIHNERDTEIHLQF